MSARKQSTYDRILAAIRSAGYTGSIRSWCAEAGVSEAYLSALRVRCLKNPDASIRGEEGMKIATALGQTIDDLLGTSKSVTETSFDRAVVAARALGISEAAIDAARTIRLDRDPGRFGWFRIIETEEWRLKGERPSAVFRSIERK